MSYCRLTDTSDVYAYQDDLRGFLVLVGNSRLPALPDDQADAMTMPEFRDWLRGNMKPIGGRFDGKTFEEKTPHALFCRLRDLLSVGYRVEPDTWVHIHRHHPELGLDAAGLVPVERPAPKP